jgi:hypothetical protein
MALLLCLPTAGTLFKIQATDSDFKLASTTCATAARVAGLSPSSLKLNALDLAHRTRLKHHAKLTTLASGATTNAKFHPAKTTARNNHATTKFAACGTQHSVHAAKFLAQATGTKQSATATRSASGMFRNKIHSAA